MSIDKQRVCFGIPVFTSVINTGMQTLSAGSMMSRVPKILDTSDPDFSNVILLLPLDGSDAATNTTDLSNDARTETFLGSAQLDTAQFKFGTASLLLEESTSDAISYPNSADFTPGAVDFTIEAHIRLSSVGSRIITIIGYRTTGSQHGWDFIVDDVSDQLRFIGWANGVSSPQISITGSTSLVVNTWYHVAAVNNGGVWDIYLDGTSEDSGTEANPLTDPSQPLYIGRDTTNGGRDFDGWIDNVRITRGVSRYTSNFTPPTEAYPTS